MTEPNAGIYAKLQLMNVKLTKTPSLPNCKCQMFLFFKNILSFKNWSFAKLLSFFVSVSLVRENWRELRENKKHIIRTLVTKQVDIDIYYDLGGKMEVKNIDDEDGIILKIPRMKKKKPELVDFDNSPVKSGT